MFICGFLFCYFLMNIVASLAFLYFDLKDTKKLNKKQVVQLIVRLPVMIFAGIIVIIVTTINELYL